MHRVRATGPTDAAAHLRCRCERLGDADATPTDADEAQGAATAAPTAEGADARATAYRRLRAALHIIRSGTTKKKCVVRGVDTRRCRQKRGLTAFKENQHILHQVDPQALQSDGIPKYEPRCTSSGVSEAVQKMRNCEIENIELYLKTHVVWLLLLNFWALETFS